MITEKAWHNKTLLFVINSHWSHKNSASKSILNPLQPVKLRSHSLAFYSLLFGESRMLNWLLVAKNLQFIISLLKIVIFVILDFTLFIALKIILRIS